MFISNAKYEGFKKFATEKMVEQQIQINEFKKFATEKMVEQQIQINELKKELKDIPLNTKDLIQQLHERICELEKIVKNQPLIKKYQKTLDIFLKNAQD